MSPPYARMMCSVRSKVFDLHIRNSIPTLEDLWLSFFSSRGQEGYFKLTICTKIGSKYYNKKLAVVYWKPPNRTAAWDPLSLQQGPTIDPWIWINRYKTPFCSTLQSGSDGLEYTWQKTQSKQTVQTSVGHVPPVLVPEAEVRRVMREN